MDPDDFDYPLPEELIAQAPLPERGASRLLRVPAGGPYSERRFDQIGEWLVPGDVLVINNTRVIPARLHGRKLSGGRVEMLLERLVGDRQAWVQLKASRPPAPGARLIFDPDIAATVIDRDNRFFLLEFAAAVAPTLQQHGHVPLPPYIARADDPADRERYQTVYARKTGAVAAPTAGLHFDADLLAKLRQQGVQIVEITLHVGAGTFLPLRPEQLEQKRLHAEVLSVGPAAVAAIKAAQARGNRTIAVGTTVMRALESSALSGELQPCEGETEIFITPGFRFRVVDMLITNFHLPKSSLMMLVAAFAGREEILAAYRHALAERYRFFSYGDAMLLEKKSE
ncbi:MAG: tRNA preQ1(34) S-adenosylmethionine ribosyltransferase-isomerase QueA [Gammaproteobacteria bacterium]|jgi:S-adenosylmethionine:tRNA ribosyltransferase-isomerase|nr:tRNA preQ1(34) S-adenosylmethionine ribosyltransferase-isomerase QueA [Gammaproteobacteria bacterium]